MTSPAPTTHQSLTAWLTRVLDAKEAAALQAVGYESRVYWENAARDFHLRPASIGHYMHWDPESVLAMVEGLRAIVARESNWVRCRNDAPAHQRHRESDVWGDGRPVDWVQTPDGRLDGAAAEAFIREWYEPSPPSQTLLDVAAMFRNEPGYDEAVGS